MNKIRLKSLVVALGISSTLTATSVAASVSYYNWGGFFTLLDNDGTVIHNTSIDYKTANQFQTPITGTLAFDGDTGAGLATISATIAPFDFFNNDPNLPVELHDISLQAIGDGLGGAGSLVIGNMLADWNGFNDMPASIVWDAAGLINGISNGDLADGVLDQADVAAYGAVPASDGTYTDAYRGYLGLGPVPMATTEWNTTVNCIAGVDCIANSTSGVLPLVFDNAFNGAEYLMGDGVGIGGSPMLDGPFLFNPNFDITYLEFTGEDVSYQIAPFNEVLGLASVPVPAAIWLFGSGLLGLLAVARKKT